MDDEAAEPSSSCCWRDISLSPEAHYLCPPQHQQYEPPPHTSQPPRERTAPCLSFSELLDDSCIPSCELLARHPADDGTTAAAGVTEQHQLGVVVGTDNDRPTSHMRSTQISGFDDKCDDSSAEPFDTSVADKADANPAITRDMQQDMDFLNLSPLRLQLAGEYHQQDEAMLTSNKSGGVVVPVKIKPEDLLGQLLLSSLDCSPCAFGKDIRFSGVKRRNLSESTSHDDGATAADGKQQAPPNRSAVGRQRKPTPIDELDDEQTTQPAAELTKREANRLAVHRHRQRRQDHLRELTEENMTLKQRLAALVQHVKELTSGAPTLTLAERKELQELRAMKQRVTEAIVNTPSAL